MTGHSEGVGLGGLVRSVDQRLFVGRDDLLSTVAEVLAGAAQHRIAYLWGPGGVGKSALLRSVVRRAREAGRTVVEVDPRLIALDPVGLAAALEPARSAAAPVVVIDEMDQLAPLRFELRRMLLDLLPADSAVLLAGRTAPDRQWLDGGIEHVTAVLRVRPLDRAESAAVLAGHGLSDPDLVAETVAWAQGYPLALTVAATLRRTDQGADGAVATTDGDLDASLLERLGGLELQGVDPDVLDVAAVAAAVDARLLAAVLPGRPTRQGLADLRRLSLSEPLGSRTTLHALARTALRSRLRGTDPERYRTLVLAVADHLRSRAGIDDAAHLGEMASLLEDGIVRFGFAPSATHYADRVRPGDLDELARLTGHGDAAWFARMRRWGEESPDNVFAVRRVTGELASLAIAYNGARCPAFARDFPEVRAVRAHAERGGWLDRSTFLQDVVVLDLPAVAEVVRVGNAGVMARLGPATPRHIYATADVFVDDGTGLKAIGYDELPELRRRDGERDLITLHCDFGPGGVLGRLHAMVRAEQEDHDPRSEPATWLFDALRSHHDDAALASLPGERTADDVRRDLVAALDRAFGPSEADQGLRRALQRAYLDPDGGHGVAQRELYMSRASFYRYLQRGREQLVTRGS